MYRLAHVVHAGQARVQDRVQDQDLERDWSAQNQAVVAVVRAAPGLARLRAVVATVRAAPGQAPLQRAAAAAATERRAADHRVGSPAEEDSWQEDS
jgi:hypothetical protein